LEVGTVGIKEKKEKKGGPLTNKQGTGSEGTVNGGMWGVDYGVY